MAVAMQWYTILQPLVVPFLAQHGLRLFQHDNARAHVIRLSTDFLRQQRISVVPWPSLSPDLNPIEHLWAERGRRVRTRAVQPLNLGQLKAALIQEWRAILQFIIQRCVLSMSRRRQALIRTRGGGEHNRY